MRIEDVRVGHMVAMTLDGTEMVEKGDPVSSEPRGDWNGRAMFLYASRPTVPGKSGKVVVEWMEGNGPRTGTQGEYYANVFGLRVDALLTCGCPLNVYEDTGHQEGCAVYDQQ